MSKRGASRRSPNYTYAESVNYDKAPTWFHGKLIRRLGETHVFSLGSDHGRFVIWLKKEVYAFSVPLSLPIPLSPKKTAFAVRPRHTGYARELLCVCGRGRGRYICICMSTIDGIFTHQHIWVNEKNYLSFVTFYRLILIQFEYRRIYVYPRLGRFSHLTNIKWNLTNRYNFRW